MDLSDNYILILSCEGNSSQWNALRSSLFGPDMFPVNVYDAHFHFDADDRNYREQPPSDDDFDAVDDAANYEDPDDYFQEEENENHHLGNRSIDCSRGYEVMAAFRGLFLLYPAMFYILLIKLSVFSSRRNSVQIRTLTSVGRLPF